MISIIIPIYNSEKYLIECLDSVLTQTYTDFELLLINDGSTDLSGEICDNYWKKDIRIKVFHQKNDGVSSARNLGLDNAKGDWVTFIDSDDFVNSSFLDDLLMDSFENDFVINGMISGRNNSTDSPSISRKDFIDLFKLYPIGPCSKMFKNKIIANKNLRFDENLSFGEDTIFVLNYLKYTNNILYRNNCDYHYRQIPEESLSKKNYDFDTNYYFVKKLRKCFEEIDIDANNNIHNHDLSIPLMKLFNSVFISEYSKGEQLEKIRILIDEYKFEYLNTFSVRKKNKLFYYLFKNEQIFLIYFLYQIYLLKKDYD